MNRSIRYQANNKSELIDALKNAYATELPPADQNEGVNTYHMGATNSMICSINDEEKQEIIQALMYFEKAEQKLLLTKNPLEIQKAHYCKVACEALRKTLLMH